MQNRIIALCVVAVCSAIYGFATQFGADEEGEVNIGYIGCSNTIQTVQGYEYVDGRKMWASDMGYDGGAVKDWVDGTKKENKFWQTFDKLLAENPETEAIWWQLCIREQDPATYADLVPVLDAVRTRIPGVAIFVTPLPKYTKGVCRITGSIGIERGYELVQELDSKNEDVFLGPELGPMTPEYTDPDGCHLTTLGKEKLGNQMKVFFDEKYGDDDSGKPIGDFSFSGKMWRNRIEDALGKTSCPEIPKPVYPSGYYTGPLVDTHLHLPAIPDGGPDDDEEGEEREGRFGGPAARLGKNIKMSEIACNLKREGTHDNFAFFPIYDSIPGQALEIANRTMKEYPDLFTPFIMPPGPDDVPPTVEAPLLKQMIEFYPNLFEGYGEIALYENENGRPAYPPDLALFEEIYPIVKANKLTVYFHPGEKQKSNFERVLKKHPDINFVVHGDEIEEVIISLMDKYPNIYYGLDDFWGPDMDLFHMFVGDSKEKYLKTMGSEFDMVLEYEVKKWKKKIERHADRFLWGTDRGDAVWNYDLEVGQSMSKFIRAFIGQLDPAAQELFAYKNAERLMGRK